MILYRKRVIRLDCRKACSSTTAFIEGTIPARKQTSLIWHYQHCESCREELAISLVLHKAMYALEDESADFDFINEDQDEAASRMLQEAEAKAMREHRFFYRLLGLKVVTFWAVMVTAILQFYYWRIIGY